MLPDSRLRDRRKASIMADWTNPDGSVIRIELVTTWCAQCGRQGPYTPAENMAHMTYVCQGCWTAGGNILANYQVPEDEFDRLVNEELVKRFGHLPSPEEIDAAAERGDLGRALDLLNKESPYRG